MLRFKVTNISKAPRYLIEAARLLQPGESVSVNRLDASTKADTKTYQVEEGEFAKIAVKAPPKPVVTDEDEEENKGVSPSTMKVGAATLTDIKPTKRVVPLEAPGAEDEETPEEDDEPVRSASTQDDDELDALIPAADKPEADKPAEPQTGGFVDRKGLSDDETP